MSRNESIVEKVICIFKFIDCIFFISEVGNYFYGIGRSRFVRVGVFGIINLVCINF